MTSSRIGRVSSSARSSSPSAARLSPRQSRATAGGGEPLAGAQGEGRIGPAELVLVARSLLEVIADDLVELHELAAAARARRQSARAAPRARLSGARRRRRRGSAGGGSGSRPHLRTAPARGGSAPAARARPAVASPAPPQVRAPARRRGGRPRPRPRRARARAARPDRAGRGAPRATPSSVAGTATSCSASPAIAEHLADEERIAARRRRDLRAQLLGHAASRSAWLRPPR